VGHERRQDFAGLRDMWGATEVIFPTTGIAVQDINLPAPQQPDEKVADDVRIL
jgi:hypothetical protein